MPRLSSSRFFWIYVIPPLAVLALSVSSLILGSETLYHRDVLVSHYPLKAGHDQVVEAGDPFPLLDPHRSGGQPLLGNPNVVAFYPSNLLYRVGSTLWALNAHFWLHWLLAPFAVFWLAREWGLTRPAAWAAGLTYGFSGYFLSQLNLYNLITGAVWIPAFAAACLRSTRAQSAWPSPLLAVAWALLILGGDPMSALMGLGLGASTWIARRPERIRAALGSFIGSLTLGTLLAAPMWVEFLRILPMSYRGYWRYSAATTLAQSWNPATAIEWLIPFFFGNLDYDFWGYNFFGGNPPLFYSLFPGILAIALVLTSGKLTRGDGLRFWAWSWMLVGGFVATGYYNPVILWLYELPGASALRYPVKCWVLVAVAASILAGRGFQRFLDGDRFLSKLLGGACLAYLLIWGSVIVMPSPIAEFLRGLHPEIFTERLFAHQRLQWATTSFFALAAGLCLWLVSRQAGRRPPEVVGAILLLVHVAFQCFLLQPLFDSDDVSHYRPHPELVAEIPTGARIAHGTFNEQFGKRPPEALAKLPGRELFWLTREEFASLGHFAGVPLGYEYELNFSPEGLDTFYSRTMNQAFRTLDDLSRIRLLAAIGTDRLLLTREPEGVAQDEVKLISQVEGVAFDTYHYEIQRVMPKIQLVGKIKRAEHMNHAVELIGDPGFDPRETAVLPGPGPELDGPAGSVEVISESLERVKVRVVSEEGGLLTTRRAWLPMYRARLDDQDAPVEVMNIYKLGVLVPPGEHRVVIETDRRPTYAALTAAAVALAFVIFCAWRGRRQGAL